MADAELTAEAAAIVRALEAAWQGERCPAAMAFDGDGTLWSGDVGEDVFVAALQHRLLREPALPALRQLADRHGVEATGDASTVAGRLYQAYREGHFPEREICEVMTWCYAGWSEEELRIFTRRVLVEEGLEARRNRDLAPIVAWARRRAIGTVVISASPRIVVEEAAREWAFAPEDIAAGAAAVEGGRIAPRLVGSLPYGKHKREAGLALLAGADWLGSFGDSDFDVDMLRSARVPVAVRPRPGLLARLGELPAALRLGGG